jgi:hypothetical protein
VLAGTILARDETGAGGTPFIQGINSETGAQEWLQELSGMPGNPALVTSIIPMPEYGYLLSLAGVTEGEYAPPYMLVRVNEQGRLLQHVTY